MKELMISGGIEFMVPLTIIAIAIFILSIKKVVDLYINKNSRADYLKKGLHAILFLGSFCFALGVLGQTLGIYQMLQFISGSTTEIRPQIIAAGLQVSMIPTLYGLLIFIMAALFWFMLHLRFKQLTGRVTNLS